MFASRHPLRTSRTRSRAAAYRLDRERQGIVRLVRDPSRREYLPGQIEVRQRFLKDGCNAIRHASVSVQGLAPGLTA